MVEVQAAHQCPSCGTPLSRERWSQGLCPGCLIELALDDTSLEAELEPGEAPTLQFSAETFSEGQIQGDRYRIRSLLGRGGMGEVWRAYDLKLRQDVALKALRTELIKDAQALETLRQEVRVAREVISPNVCRVFDLQELDGQELVSMEYIDGKTLQELLKEQSPLELNKAREIASQFLAGLEAIHEAGLVHRDIKPENVMITRTARVVVMDFGIAKSLGDAKSGLAAGTPAYMSPEQARSGELDARADVFAAGVVLAEMVAPGGIKSFEHRRRVWEGAHQEPSELAETPWAGVVRKAVSGEREERFPSAAALARALEEVTLRAAGDEDADPYPGLASFTQDQSKYFFGRELEVEALWKKLRRPHLLAVIGPSGAGKSSFLQAGLLPTLSEGWDAIVATPGNRPLSHLARQLAPKLADDPETVDRLLRFEELDIAVELFSEWRRQVKHGLVVVDQFEELFTQSPPEIQGHFADLLGRLPLEADVHVLLSMRGDFLDHCHRHQALQPILSDLTLLGPPTGASLRRAMVQPALKCGYRFEDESIVEEMLAEVEGQRGALPMVAFAAAQLWEKRDRNTGLLTKETYEHIGGVGGALAQHAEATLERIGQDRIPTVRELFRNLVTAQGTRAARDRDELLSVFDGDRALVSDVGAPLVGARSREGTSPSPTTDRTAAERVLTTLIDARLLTSYQVPAANEEEHDTHHRIEIVHESLLSNWPRLVRWQTQDQEGAQLRDELRQAAQLWEQHDRAEDFLWTGTAYREFQLWRERYPGGLSELEDDFAQAMENHATRRRRRRRLAVAAAFAALLAVLVIVGTFWRQSEVAKEEAVAEARRAEAAKLLALAQLSLEEDPTEALAYTTASLELADTEEVRVFALKTLSKAPPALVLDGLGRSGRRPIFSSDGRWLATAGHAEEVLVWSQDGGGPLRLPGHKPSSQGEVDAAWYEDRFLVTGHWTEERARIWSFPGGELFREINFGANAYWQVGVEHLFATVIETDAKTGHEIFHLRSWQLPDGEVEELGTVDRTALGSIPAHFFDPSGRSWIYRKGNEIFYRQLPVQDGVPARLVGQHVKAALTVMPTEPDRLWTLDASTGEYHLWDLSASNAEHLRTVARPADATEGTWVRPDLTWRWFIGQQGGGRSDGVRIWDRQALPSSRELQLRRRASWYGSISDFHLGSQWVVASVENWDQVVFWPLPQNPPSVIESYTGLFRPLVFSPDSRWLVTHWPGRSLRLWPLSGSLEKSVRVLHEGEISEDVVDLTFDSAGQRLMGTGYGPDLFVASLDGSSLQKLEGFSSEHLVAGLAAFSPSGHLVAAGTTFGTGIEKALRVWNLATGETRVFDLEQTKDQQVGDHNEQPSESGTEGGVVDLVFTDESTLYTAGLDGAGVLRWDLESGTWERIVSAKPGRHAFLWLSGDRQQLITRLTPFWVECSPGERTPLVLHNLRTGSAKNLTTVVECTDFPLAFDSSLTVYVAGQEDGTLRVGRIGGDEPHLLTGHQGRIDRLAISPDLQWIASTGQDDTLRLWPMPDLDKPPLHTLPLEELLARLESLTNLRAVRDEASSTGWSIEIGPFPGWQEVPTW